MHKQLCKVFKAVFLELCANHDLAERKKQTLAKFPCWRMCYARAEFDLDAALLRRLLRLSISDFQIH